ncbi:MAG: hypothetical protein EOP10_02665 [Proteobacteria bacterium]|nr:MAG: hypothetical protein EOP10_02665 [Pseudomonadota bacterium]
MRVLFSLMFAAFLVSPHNVFAADLLALRQAEKISLSLTGKPLSDSRRESFLKGKITLEQLADELSKDDDFIEYFAMFYTRTLGFQIPFNAYELKDSKGGESFSSILSLSYPETYNAEYASRYDAAKLASNAKSMSGPMQIRLKDCGNAVSPELIFDVSEAGNTDVNEAKKSLAVIRAAKEGVGPDGNPIKTGTAMYWKEILPIYESANLPCDAKQLVDINPWWDPVEVTVDAKYKGVKTYKVPPIVIEHCGGKTLPLCNTKSLNDKDALTDTFNRDLMMEPGYIISHTVAEDRPFSEILTTPDTIMTGTYGAWMHYNGPKLWANYPGGDIEGKKDPIFNAPDASDRTHHRITRNSLHAGVLTTPAYQLLTNGRRAKANKAFETFYCSKFTVPTNAKPDPSDSNPDLTKRAFCKYCHITLEPMASFFNNWPLTGNLNYIYTGNADDQGTFLGRSGKGAAAFGSIMVEADTFAACSVRRAFEFVNGRKMSQTEADLQLPRYVSVLLSNNLNLRIVIKSMVADPSFRNPAKE